MGSNEFKLGQTVYHRQVYRHGEPLKIVGIREDELELEGDYSGGVLRGTAATPENAFQRQWMPIEGVSFIYRHEFKESVRNKAKVLLDELSFEDFGGKFYGEMMDFIGLVLSLTNEVEYNKEFKKKGSWPL